MKSARWTAAVLLLLLFGASLGAMLFDNPAVAQTGSATSAGRYQISAYAGTTADGLGHGCYIVDTTTGQVWHTRLGGSAENVSGKLP